MSFYYRLPVVEKCLEKCLLVYLADLTMEEVSSDTTNLQTNPIEVERNSRYGDDVQFWRINKNVFQVLIYIQTEIIRFQKRCSKWHISINTVKTMFTLFCDKKGLNSPSLMTLPINNAPFNPNLGEGNLTPC